MNCECKEYDLIVIGGGAAGFSSLIEAKKRGKKALLINDNKNVNIGGTCVNIGCVPSKALIEMSKDMSFEEAMKKAREIVEKLREKNYMDVLKEWDIEFIEGKAKLVDKNSVEVNGNKYKASYILIATGASPFIPNIKGLEDVNYKTYRDILSLERAEEVVFIGGGRIALELSQAFGNFRIKAKILQRSTILKGFSEEVKRFVKEELSKSIEIVENVNIKEVEQGKVITDKGEFSFDLLFIATGIKPNIVEGVKELGIEVERGAIKVNEYLQTNISNIYAAGDVTKILPLETTAAKQGKTAVNNMFGEKKKIDYSKIPSVMFGNYEIAKVGKLEGESRVLYFDELERAVVKGEKGLIKMYANGEKINGFEVVSKNAGEIIGACSYVLNASFSIEELNEISLAFPTMMEMIKKVSLKFKESKKLPCCAG